MSRTVALVPARDEADRIALTVRALRGIAGLDEVVVVDDGSSDATASEAFAAGARVLLSRRPVGKGAAIESALRRLPPADVWLFADGDLGATASGLEPVLRRVVDGQADLAIATFPPAEGGGFGLVKRFAAWSIHRICGFVASEPLSGQRALTAEALGRCRPLAEGFGLETAMTIDAVRAKLRVEEMAADLSHRPTGRDLRGFWHRGRQGADIARAVLRRTLSRP